MDDEGATSSQPPVHKVRRYEAENRRRKEKDPCLAETQLSLTCLAENSGSRSVCHEYILNVRACKDFWNNVRIYRKRNNLVPHIPPPEERQTIKSEWFDQVKREAERRRRSGDRSS